MQDKLDLHRGADVRTINFARFDRRTVLSRSALGLALPVAASAGWPDTGDSLAATGPQQMGERQRKRMAMSSDAFSEARLIAFAYAYEQATLNRRPPASTPPLPGDFVRRPR